MSNWGNPQLFWLQAANDSHFGDLQMSKKRYLLQKKMPYNISHLCGAIVSSFNGEQLKKCDSLYISKGIREYSRGVFITHDLGYPAYAGSSEAKCIKVNQYFNKFCLNLEFCYGFQHVSKFIAFGLNTLVFVQTMSSELIVILVYFITFCHGWPCSYRQQGLP